MDPPQGDIQIDPSMDPTVVADVRDEDTPTIGTSRVAPSLRSMLERVLETQSSHYTMTETFMTTQAAHGQILDSLITDVATLRIEFNEYGSSSSPSSPLDD